MDRRPPAGYERMEIMFGEMFECSQDLYNGAEKSPQKKKIVNTRFYTIKTTEKQSLKTLLHLGSIFVTADCSGFPFDFPCYLLFYTKLHLFPKRQGK